MECRRVDLCNQRRQVISEGVSFVNMSHSEYLNTTMRRVTAYVERINYSARDWRKLEDCLRSWEYVLTGHGEGDVWLAEQVAYDELVDEVEQEDVEDVRASGGSSDVGASKGSYVDADVGASGTSSSSRAAPSSKARLAPPPTPSAAPPSKPLARLLPAPSNKPTTPKRACPTKARPPSHPPPPPPPCSKTPTPPAHPPPSRGPAPPAHPPPPPKPTEEEEEDVGGRRDVGSRGVKRHAPAPSGWCPQCHVQRAVCFQVGDWACPFCGQHNFPDKTQCSNHRCRREKSEVILIAPDPQGELPPPSAVAWCDSCGKWRSECWMKNDWECPWCKNHNYARKQVASAL